MHESGNYISQGEHLLVTIWPSLLPSSPYKIIVTDLFLQQSLQFFPDNICSAEAIYPGV